MHKIQSNITMSLLVLMCRGIFSCNKVNYSGEKKNYEVRLRIRFFIIPLGKASLGQTYCSELYSALLSHYSSLFHLTPIGWKEYRRKDFLGCQEFWGKVFLGCQEFGGKVFLGCQEFGGKDFLGCLGKRSYFPPA